MPAVMLVHSWGSTPGTMSVLARRLGVDGFAPSCARLGGLAKTFNTNGVEASASLLALQVKNLAAKSPSGRIAIVGHSLGGVIARWFVSAMGGAAFVHTIVTLGSPHRGSPFALKKRLFLLRRLSQGLRDIAPDSPLITRMKQMQIPAETYVASIYSPVDTYCPRPYAEIEIPPGAGNIVNVDAGDYSHEELVIDEGVYSLIRRELEIGINRSVATFKL